MLYHAAFLSEDQGLSQPSCDERPGGSRLAFAPDNIATRIPAITAGHSLSPPSHTRTANSAPCGLPALKGQRYGLTTFLDRHTTGLGSVYSPVAFMTTCSHYKQEHPATYRLVNACQLLWHLKINDVYRQFTCITHASQPSALPRYSFEDRRHDLTAMADTLRWATFQKSFRQIRYQRCLSSWATAGRTAGQSPPEKKTAFGRL